MSPQVVIQNMNVLIVNQDARGVTAENETMLDYYVALGVELPAEMCKILASIPRRGKITMTALQEKTLRDARDVAYPSHRLGAGI